MTQAHAAKRVAETCDLRVFGCIRGAESTLSVGVVKIREVVFLLRTAARRRVRADRDKCACGNRPR